MARRSVLLVCFTVIVCVYGAAAFAQDVPAAAPPGADPPAHVAFVEGTAVLERDGQIESDPVSMPLLAGDRLRTEDGRVEVLFADGSTLHLDNRTVIDFQSDQVIRLLAGRLRLAIGGPAGGVNYRIDAPAAWVQIGSPGEYRVAVVHEDVELAVLRGAAELVNEQGRSYIGAGERTFARAGAAPSSPYVFNSAAWDDFDRWSEARRGLRLGTSAQYLPPDVRPYAAAMDSYGSWRYEQTYGYVWYPRVAAGWRPYRHGRWVSLRPYGWTWIGRDPWGWPTHHYGRWGISAGSWFWIPGRQWGPAWVSWAYAPDYVSWCPLGWNNRPVLQIVNVNVFGGRRYSAWDAWTVVPRRHFSSGYINVTRLAAERVAPRLQQTFVVRDNAPAVHYAVGRDTPIRSAGHLAIPRPGSGTVYGGAGGARVTPGDARSSERGFPQPSRAPRSPAGAAPPVAGGAPAGRAVARERNGAGAEPAPGAVPADAAGPSRPSRRGVQPGVRGSAQPPAVTPAPDGAVRAIPRVRPEAPAATEGGDHGRARQEGAPGYSAPVPARPRASEVDPYRPAPGVGRTPLPGAEYRGRAVPRTAAPAAEPSRSAEPARPAPPGGGDDGGYRRAPSRPAPDSGGEYRGRAMPRSEPNAPSGYRAPERQAPAGPPPAASAPPPSRPSGDEGQAGPSRRPSGEGAQTGTARRRR